MSVRIEWHDAKHVSAEVYPPGNDDWVGSGDQGDDFALCISTDGGGVSTVHGSYHELLTFARNLVEAVEAHRLSTPGKEYDHIARPDSDAKVCRECGEDITWVGPGFVDYLHVDDKENR